MNLWLVEPNRVPTGKVGLTYDCNSGYVIAALSPAGARKLAAENAADEGAEFWKSTRNASVTKIGDSHYYKVACVVLIQNTGA